MERETDFSALDAFADDPESQQTQDFSALDAFADTPKAAKPKPRAQRPKRTASAPANKEAERRQRVLDRLRGLKLDMEDDVFDDFDMVTKHESGRRHFDDAGRVIRGVPTKSGERAIGFSQVMPSTAKKWQKHGLNPDDEIDNIAIGALEFRSGSDDPIGRRLAYVGGPKSRALKYYKKHGEVPDWKMYSYLPNNKETFRHYVDRTGGFKDLRRLDEVAGGITRDPVSGAPQVDFKVGGPTAPIAHRPEDIAAFDAKFRKGKPPRQPALQPGVEGAEDPNVDQFGKPFKYEWQKTGDVGNGLKYAGEIDGRYFAKNEDGDTYELDEKTKQFKPTAPTKRAYDAEGNEYQLDANQDNVPEGHVRRLRDGKPFVFSPDGTIREEGVPELPPWVAGKTPPKSELPPDPMLRKAYQTRLEQGFTDSEELRQKFIEGWAAVQAGKQQRIFTDEEIKQIEALELYAANNAQQGIVPQVQETPTRARRAPRSTTAGPSTEGIGTFYADVDPATAPLGSDPRQHVFEQAVRQLGNELYGRPLDKVEVQAAIEFQKRRGGDFVYLTEGGKATNVPTEPTKGRYQITAERAAEIRDFLKFNQPLLERTRDDAIAKFIASTFEIDDAKIAEFAEMGINADRLRAALESDPKFADARKKRLENEQFIKDYVAKQTTGANATADSAANQTGRVLEMLRSKDPAENRLGQQALENLSRRSPNIAYVEALANLGIVPRDVLDKAKEAEQSELINAIASLNDPSWYKRLLNDVQDGGTGFYEFVVGPFKRADRIKAAREQARPGKDGKPSNAGILLPMVYSAWEGPPELRGVNSPEAQKRRREAIGDSLRSMQAEFGSIGEFHKFMEANAGEEANIGRQLKFFGSNVLKNIASFGKSAAVIDSAAEDLEVLGIKVPKDYMPTVRNAMNVVVALRNVMASGSGVMRPSDILTRDIEGAQDDPRNARLWQYARWLEEFAGDDRYLQHTFSGEVNQGLASGVVFLGAGFALKKFKYAIPALGAGMEIGNTFEEMVKAGIPVEQAKNWAVLVGAGSGYMEKFGLGGTANRMLARLGTELSDESVKTLSRSMVEFAKAAGRGAAQGIAREMPEEAIQEWAQSSFVDAAVKAIAAQNPSEGRLILNFLDELPKAIAENFHSAVIGGATGGILGGGTQTVGSVIGEGIRQSRMPGEQPEAEAEIPEGELRTPQAAEDAGESAILEKFGDRTGQATVRGLDMGGRDTAALDDIANEVAPGTVQTPQQAATEPAGGVQTPEGTQTPPATPPTQPAGQAKPKTRLPRNVIGKEVEIEGKGTGRIVAIRQGKFVVDYDYRGRPGEEFYHRQDFFTPEQLAIGGTSLTEYKPPKAPKQTTSARQPTQFGAEDFGGEIIERVPQPGQAGQPAQPAGQPTTAEVVRKIRTGRAASGKGAAIQKFTPTEDMPIDTVYTSTNDKYDVVPVVISRDDIIGSWEEGYPELLQPRDRDSIASDAQADEIARNLIPAKLGDNVNAGDGRMLVVPVEVDGKIKYALITGNGRTLALDLARERYPERFEEYQGFAKSKDPSVQGDNLMYVGILDNTKLEDGDLRQIAVDANKSTVAAMSPVEQAKVDSETLDSSLMQKFVVNDAGDIDTAGNREFIADTRQDDDQDEALSDGERKHIDKLIEQGFTATTGRMTPNGQQWFLLDTKTGSQEQISRAGRDYAYEKLGTPDKQGLRSGPMFDEPIEMRGDTPSDDDLGKMFDDLVPEEDSAPSLFDAEVKAADADKARIARLPDDEFRKELDKISPEALDKHADRSNGGRDISFTTADSPATELSGRGRIIGEAISNNESVFKVRHYDQSKGEWLTAYVAEADVDEWLPDGTLNEFLAANPDSAITKVGLQNGPLPEPERTPETVKKALAQTKRQIKKLENADEVDENALAAAEQQLDSLEAELAAMATTTAPKPEDLKAKYPVGRKLLHRTGGKPWKVTGHQSDFGKSGQIGIRLERGTDRTIMSVADLEKKFKTEKPTESNRRTAEDLFSDTAATIGDLFDTLQTFEIDPDATAGQLEEIEKIKPQVNAIKGQSKAAKAQREPLRARIRELQAEITSYMDSQETAWVQFTEDVLQQLVKAAQQYKLLEQPTDENIHSLYDVIERLTDPRFFDGINMDVLLEDHVDDLLGEAFDTIQRIKRTFVTAPQTSDTTRALTADPENRSLTDTPEKRAAMSRAYLAAYAEDSEETWGGPMDWAAVDQLMTMPREEYGLVGVIERFMTDPAVAPILAELERSAGVSDAEIEILKDFGGIYGLDPDIIEDIIGEILEIARDRGETDGGAADTLPEPDGSGAPDSDQGSETSIFKEEPEGEVGNPDTSGLFAEQEKQEDEELSKEAEAERQAERERHRDFRNSVAAQVPALDDVLAFENPFYNAGKFPKKKGQGYASNEEALAAERAELERLTNRYNANLADLKNPEATEELDQYLWNSAPVNMKLVLTHIGWAKANINELEKALGNTPPFKAGKQKFDWYFPSKEEVRETDQADNAATPEAQPPSLEALRGAEQTDLFGLEADNTGLFAQDGPTAIEPKQAEDNSKAAIKESLLSKAETEARRQVIETFGEEIGELLYDTRNDKATPKASSAAQGIISRWSGEDTDSEAVQQLIADAATAIEWIREAELRGANLDEFVRQAAIGREGLTIAQRKIYDLIASNKFGRQADELLRNAKTASEVAANVAEIEGGLEDGKVTLQQLIDVYGYTHKWEQNKKLEPAFRGAYVIGRNDDFVYVEEVYAGEGDLPPMVDVVIEHVGEFSEFEAPGEYVVTEDDFYYYFGFDVRIPEGAKVYDDYFERDLEPDSEDGTDDVEVREDDVPTERTGDADSLRESDAKPPGQRIEPGSEQSLFGDSSALEGTPGDSNVREEAAERPDAVDRDAGRGDGVSQEGISDDQQAASDAGGEAVPRTEVDLGALFDELVPPAGEAPTTNLFGEQSRTEPVYLGNQKKVRKAIEAGHGFLAVAPSGLSRDEVAKSDIAIAAVGGAIKHLADRAAELGLTDNTHTIYQVSNENVWEYEIEANRSAESRGTTKKQRAAAKQTSIPRGSVPITKYRVYDANGVEQVGNIVDPAIAQRQLEHYPGGRIEAYDGYILKEFADKLTSAKESTGKGIDEAIKGLGKLFDPKKFKSSTVPAFDDETYQAAKPHFLEAYNHFKDAAQNIGDAMRLLIDQMRAEGYDNETLRLMKPYIVQFVADIRDGVIGQDLTTPEDIIDSVPEPESKDAAERLEQQKAAEGKSVKIGDLANIQATVPVLFKEQHEDVRFVEDALFVRDGNGVMLTNGTGTGKTFSGLGVVKRMAMQGKDNIFIVVPSQEIANAWISAATNFGLQVRQLADTQDNGAEGIVITTYANMQQNPSLIKRQWDLIVADEAHTLSSNKDGKPTGASKALRAMTLHKRGKMDYWRQATIKEVTEREQAEARIEVVRALLERYEDEGPQMADRAKEAREELRSLEDAVATLNKQIEKIGNAAVAEWDRRIADEPKGKALMLSATPFAYRKSVDYAEGYLFDYDDGKVPDDQLGRTRHYNEPNNQEAFMIEHFGYRMRYNKLTEPGPEVDTDIMERQFNTWLKQQRVLSGRMLGIDQDYSREFLLIKEGIGQKIDDGLKWLQEAEGGRFRPLAEIVNKSFSYHNRMFLLEAIKAKAAVPIIDAHVEAGRKVVVFHKFNVGGGFHPFKPKVPNEKTLISVGGKTIEVNLKDLYAEFTRKRPDLIALPFEGLESPIETFAESFKGGATSLQHVQLNGTQSKKANRESMAIFNTDNSEIDIILVQADKGQAGISLHDTTGKHQRVMIDLGLPSRPVEAIQKEGRIYRLGTKTNAPMFYFTTGTLWEATAFAQTMAERSSTAENLSLGEEARALRQSIIDSFLEPRTDPMPTELDGVGGKERDRAGQQAISEYERAKTFFFGQQKKTSKTKSAEGEDYYPTPEPLGLKMVEFADIAAGHSVLEPSAGHGAIARFLPQTSRNTVIEPSQELMTRLRLHIPPSDTNRFEQDVFESLDVRANKFDVVLMNPPYGKGGKTAMEHLAKAFEHLRTNGRVVAILPEGPAADKRLEQLMAGQTEKARKLIVRSDPNTFAPLSLYEGDTVQVTDKGTIYGVTRAETVRRGFEFIATLHGTDAQGSPMTMELRGSDRFDKVIAGPRIVPASTRVVKTAEISLPTKTFERAGTGVKTRMVVLDKLAGKELELHEPWGLLDLSDVRTFDELFDEFEELTIPPRPYGGEAARRAEQEAIEREAKFEAEREARAQQNASGRAAAIPHGQHAFDLREFQHTTQGHMIYVAKPTGPKMNKDEFKRISAIARTHGGYYSSFKKDGAIPGFHFRSPEARDAFNAEAEGDSTMLSIAEPAAAPAFYSAAERAIETKMPNRAPADQVRKILEGPGIKREEVEWLGVDEWLEGKRTVTKDEMLEFMRDARIQIEEKVLRKRERDERSPADRNSTDVDERHEAAREELAEMFDLDTWDIIPATVEATRQQLINDLLNRADQDDDLDEALTSVIGASSEEYWGIEEDDYEELEEAWDNLRMASREARGADGAMDEQDPATGALQYDNPDWRLSGPHSNYREFVFTLPQQYSMLRMKYRDELAAKYGSGEAVWQNWTEAEQAEFDRLTDIDLGNDANSPAFTTGHFGGMPNILFWVRATERIDADGKRVFVIEEIQSDWHQRGRKQGYNTKMPEPVFEWTTTEGVASGEWKAAISSPHGDIIGYGPTKERAAEAAKQSWRGKFSAIPDAPFKKSWHELAFKKMLRRAVEEGYDRVAWTTGKQQNKRWSLSKVVDEIESGIDHFDSNHPTRPDQEYLHITLRRDGGDLYLKVDPENGVVISAPDALLKTEGEHLSEVLPKAIADKILSEQYVLIEDIAEVEIGGEGMRGFYDKMVPGFVSKYVKKWGAKVGRTEIPTINDERSTLGGQRDRNELRKVADDFLTRNAIGIRELNDFVSTGRDISEADARAMSVDELTAYLLGTKYESLHSVDITPAMKQSVMDEGQPMFSIYEPARKEVRFYSGLERAVEGLKQEKFSVDQVMNVINKLPGIRAEELDHTLLDVFVQLQADLGARSITKDELLKKIRASKIVVEPLALGWDGDQDSAKFRGYAEPFPASREDYKEMFLTAPFAEGGWIDGHPEYADVKNPVVRIRMDKVTLDDGRRALMVHEVQGPDEDNMAKMPAVLQKYHKQMGLKYAMQYAIDQGLDAVAWTTGEQQLARYPIEKTVDRIEFSKNLSGQSLIRVTAKGDRDPIRITAGPHGTIINSSEDKFVDRKLTEVFPKALANQILEQTSGTIEGDGLKIGGDSLRNLYDKVIPAHMKKIYGRYAAKVENGEISYDPYLKLTDFRVEELELELVNPAPHLHRFKVTATDSATGLPAYRGTFLTREAAEQYIKEAKEVFRRKTHPVWTMGITDPLREALATDEQPMYSIEEENRKQAIKILKTLDIEDVVPMVEATRSGDRVKLNLPAMELLRRAFEQVDIEAGKRKVGDESTYPAFLGLFTDAAKLIKVEQALMAAAVNAAETGHPAADAMLSGLANDIADARKAGQQTAVFYVYDAKLPQEIFHQAVYLGSVEKHLTKRHARPAELDKMPQVRKAWDSFFSQQPEYSPERLRQTANMSKANAEALSKALVREEVAAWVAEGSWEELGLTKDEGQEYLFEFLESFADKVYADTKKEGKSDEDAERAVEAALRRFEEIEHVQEATQRVLAAARKEVDAGTDGRPDGRDTQGNAKGKPSGASGGVQEAPRPDAEQGAKPYDLEGFEPKTQSKVAGDASEIPETKQFPGVRSKTELASLPGTERAAGIAADDVIYTVFSDRAAQAAAKRMLTENSTEEVLKILKNTESPDVHHAIAAFSIQQSLREEATRIEATKPDEAAKLRRVSIDLGVHLAMKMVRAGRFIRAAGVILKTTDGLIAVAQKTYQDRHGVGNDLPADIIRRIEEKAGKAEVDLAEHEAFRRQMESLQRQLDALKQELAGSEDAIRTSRKVTGRRKKFVTEIRESQKESVAAALQRMQSRALIRAAFPQHVSPMSASEQQVLDDVTMMSVFDEAKLPDEILKDMGILGADILLEGLALPSDKMIRPLTFDEQMIAMYGEDIRPHLEDVHRESLRQRDVWIKENQRKKEIKAIIDELGDHLTEDDIEAIIQARADELERRVLITKLHRVRAERGQKTEAVTTIEGVIARIAKPGQEAAVAAAVELIHRKPSAQEFYRLLEAIGIKNKDAREALREGKELLDQARLVFKREEEERKDELRDRIKQGDEELHQLEKEVAASRVRARESQAEIEKELKRIGSGEFMYRVSQAREAINTPRAIMASADLSFLLRQGGWFMFARPEDQGPAFLALLNATTERFNRLGYERTMDAMEDNPYFELSVQAGMDYAGLGKHGEFSITKGEEEFRSNMLRHMANWSKGKSFHKFNIARLPNAIIQKSDELYTAFLDAQRLSTFAQTAELWASRGITFETHPKEYRALASYINDATGRAAIPELLGGSRAASLLMNLPLFAPRFTLSRFKLLWKSTLGMAFLPPETRRIVFRDALRFYGTTGALMSLAWLGGATIGFDWDDADFLKLRWGPEDKDTTDMLIGMQQSLRVTMRIIQASLRRFVGPEWSNGLIRDSLYHVDDNGRVLVNEFRAEMGLNVETSIWMNFLRTKLGPPASLMVDWVQDSNVIGEKFRWDKAIVSRVTPLGLQETVEAGYDGGVATALAAFAHTMLGVGYGHYQKSLTGQRTEAQKLAAKINGLRFSSTVETEEAKAARDVLNGLRDAARQGEDISEQVKAMYEAGDLTKQEAERLLLGGEVNPLFLQIRNMPVGLIKEVRKIATPSETEMIDTLLDSKQARKQKTDRRQSAAEELFGKTPLMRGGVTDAPTKPLAERMKRASVRDALILYQEYQAQLSDEQKATLRSELRRKLTTSSRRGTLSDENREAAEKIFGGELNLPRPRPRRRSPSRSRQPLRGLEGVY